VAQFEVFEGGDAEDRADGFPNGQLRLGFFTVPSAQVSRTPSGDGTGSETVVGSRRLVDGIGPDHLTIHDVVIEFDFGPVFEHGLERGTGTFRSFHLRDRHDFVWVHDGMGV
jgi:hypothetical protein